MNLLFGVLSLWGLLAGVGWMVALAAAADLRRELAVSELRERDAYARGQHDLLQDTDSMAGLRRRFDLGKTLDEQMPARVTPISGRRA